MRVNNDNDRPVLIVGAGPTGLTAAVELSRLGIGVRIVDRAAEPWTASRALGIQARTVELLRPRGVGDEMLRLGNQAGATALYSHGEKLGAVELHRMPSRFNYLLMLAQSETERLLTGQLKQQGVKVERGVEFVSLAQTGTDRNGVQVVLRSGDGTREVVDASYLIAADGSRSAIRKALNLPFKGRSLTQNYVLGDLHVDGEIPRGQLSIFLARNGFLAVFPMGGDRFRLMATDPGGGAVNAGEPTLQDIQRLYDRVCHLPARLHDLNWSSRFHINSRHLSTLRVNRVFFGGDAAHVHSPAGGQGMNAGIQDMINLSWKLAMVIKGQARPELLDTYQSDRLPVIRRLVAMTERATRVCNSTNPIVHTALTRLAPIVLGLDKVQNRAAPRLGQVAASYRGCPIAKGAGHIGDLHAGDRVPDIALVMTNDRHGATRLHDQLDLSVPTLFITGGQGRTAESYQPWHTGIAVRRVAVAPDQSELRGSDAEIAADLAAAGAAWLLVRPDGYLAAAGKPANSPRLTAWLRKWLVVTDR
jgi:2-polyprenyl-6-methoxyphenol hydroxylase-like FAD-dependent oxidoreductase